MQSEQKWTGTHTPEPWMVGCDEAMRFTYATQIVGRESTQTFVMAQFNGNFPDWSKANASRAVQCVNACAGLSDPAAELAQLRKDAKVLAWEVMNSRREIAAFRSYLDGFKKNPAVPRDVLVNLAFNLLDQCADATDESQQDTDASGALTRHAGDGT